MNDAELAAELARRAGELLIEIRATYSGPRTELGSVGDRRSQALLRGTLRQTRPNDFLLSEEGADNPGRSKSTRVWIIDPLDGTREFAEVGRADWAVHVALWETGNLVAGAVALPTLSRTYSTVSQPRFPGARAHGPLRIAVSRTRPPPFVTDLCRALTAVAIPMGSAGAKTIAVVDGDVDAYVHAGGQYEWDSAAPVAVALSAHLHASRLDGSDLRYNQPSPWLPDILICRREMAYEITSAARQFMVEHPPATLKDPAAEPDA